MDAHPFLLEISLEKAFSERGGTLECSRNGNVGTSLHESGYG